MAIELPIKNMYLLRLSHESLKIFVNSCKYAFRIVLSPETFLVGVAALNLYVS